MRLRERMQDYSLLIIPAAPPAIRNRDTHYPYRAASDILYLTGVSEEELALALTRDELHIFARGRDAERERWVGRVNGHEFYRERFAALPGVKQVADFTAFEKQVAELIRGKKVLYYDFGLQSELDTRLLRVLHEGTLFARRGAVVPQTITRSGTLLGECRLFKDAFDLECMRKAAAISSAAHNKAQDLIENAGAGLSEFEIKALIEREFMQSGADRLAYPSIVAAGANATVLHYEGTRGRAAQGDFILIDAGCEFQGYASDITRTTVVGGRAQASPLQRDLYALVQEAQRAAIQGTRPAATVDSVHAAAVDVLSRGLLEMGFFDGVPLRVKGGKAEPATLTNVASLDEVKELEYYNLYYMHRTSHYLGLDVHDVGDYYIGGKSRELAAGMVITVEPGLYFPEEYDFLRAEAKGIGIRIEDDVLVTDKGNEVLTASCRS